MHASDLSNFFFFNDTATTEIYTLSLHDALPISCSAVPSKFKYGFSSLMDIASSSSCRLRRVDSPGGENSSVLDRKSTRLNSSHANISYAVFCLKKKKTRAPPPC